MKFFIENQKVEREIDWVLKQVRLHMNGATTSQMEGRGIVYRQNFGVAIPHLQELAKRTPAYYELAERLWFLEIRETMLLASLIVPTDDMSTQRCLEWSKLISNKDIAERSSMFLWSRINNLKDCTEQWLKTESPYLKATALQSIAHCIKKNGQINYQIDDLLDNWWQDNLEVLKAQSFAIRMLLRKEKKGSPKLYSFIKTLNTSHNMHIKAIGQELTTELDFISNHHH